MEAILKERFNGEEVSLAGFKPQLVAVLHSMFIQKIQMTELSEGIEESLNDLAELKPVFAFRLRGQYQLKEKMQTFQNYIEKITRGTELPTPQFDTALKPAVLNHLAIELDLTINEIARMSEKDTFRQLNNLKEINIENNSKDFKKFMNDFLDGIELVGPPDED
jgi:hypothetical protein